MFMKLLQNLRLDKWYGLTFLVGLLLIGASLYFKVEFIQEKHLFGLGLGLILIGISFFMAEGYISQFIAGGILSTKIIKHSFASYSVLVIGIFLTLLFGILVILGLI